MFWKVIDGGNRKRLPNTKKTERRRHYEKSDILSISVRYYSAHFYDVMLYSLENKGKQDEKSV